MSLDTDYYKVIIHLAGQGVRPTLYFHKDDPHTSRNINNLETAVGCSVEKMLIKAPEDERKALWREHVQLGHTLLGFEAWCKDRGES